MLKDIIDTKNIKGHVIIKARVKGGEWKVLVDHKNSLTTLSKEIIAKALGGTPNYILDIIKCYKAGAPLASAATVITYPSANQVQFSSLFDENSFNDTLDEVRLNCAAAGDFSTLTGLSVLKDNTLQLNIDWLLSVI